MKHINIDLQTELKTLLENENSSDEPYNRLDDSTVNKMTHKRQKVLTLKDINRLKKIRNQKREELAQDSVFIPFIYGPQEEQGGDMGMGGMM